MTLSETLGRKAKDLMQGMRARVKRDPDIADFAAAFEPILGSISQVRQETDMSFEDLGKKIDALAGEVRTSIDERLKPFEEKYKEFREGLNQAIKTSERKGFERAVSLCAAQPAFLSLVRKRGEQWPEYFERYKKALTKKLESLQYTE